MRITLVTLEARAALLRKYRLLVRWRRAKDLSVRAPEETVEGGATPAAMRVLAEEFPGALRELDLLGLPELERRAACLVTWSVGAQTPAEPWLAWIDGYHALMRSALALRSATPPFEGHVRAQVPPADETFLRDVHHPPGGRLSTAVLQALARHFDAPVEEIRSVLFPPRRQRN